jgi:hypothetical protein
MSDFCFAKVKRLVTFEVKINLLWKIIIKLIIDN